MYSQTFRQVGHTFLFARQAAQKEGLICLERNRQTPVALNRISRVFQKSK